MTKSGIQSQDVIEVADSVSLIPVNKTHFQDIHEVFGERIAYEASQQKDIGLTKTHLTNLMERFDGNDCQAYVVKTHRNNKVVSLLLLKHKTEVMTVELWCAKDISDDEVQATLFGVRYYAEQNESVEKILFSVAKRDDEFKKLLVTSLSATVHSYTMVRVSPKGGFLETNEAVVHV